ncbi:MAG: hypothetical protein IKW66_01050, partial [Clostridia bacterium]|nr:hypothetical protein [Clostridia bacterium]
RLYPAYTEGDRKTLAAIANEELPALLALAKTVRASMGTLFSQRIERTDALSDYITRLRADGRRVFAAALDESAEQLGSFAIQKGDCAVIGNEGHGLSSSVIAACDRTVYIPMTERAESLNAAVAAALLMWEFCRQG